MAMAGQWLFNVAFSDGGCCGIDRAMSVVRRRYYRPVLIDIVTNVDGVVMCVVMVCYSVIRYYSGCVFYFKASWPVSLVSIGGVNDGYCCMAALNQFVINEACAVASGYSRRYMVVIFSVAWRIVA